MSDIITIAKIIAAILFITAVCCGVTVGGTHYSCTDCSCDEGLTFQTESENRGTSRTIQVEEIQMDQEEIEIIR
jgi:hypothetical protein